MPDFQLSNESRHKLLPELKDIDHWICWSFHKDPKSDEKIPLNTDSYLPKKERFEPGQYFDTQIWMSYRKAVHYLYEYNSIDGIGFSFIDTDYSFIDIDGCIGDDMTTNDEIIGITERINSYTELSPGERGLHILSQGNAPNYGWASEHYDLDINVHDESWVTVTQNHIKGYPLRVTGSRHKLSWVCRKYDIGKHK